MKKIKTLMICSALALSLGTAIAFSTPHYAPMFAEEPETSEPAPLSEEPQEQEEEPIVEEPKENEEENKVNEFLDKWFSPQMVATYVAYLSFIGVILGLAANIKKLKNEKQLTLENVIEKISELLSKLISEEVANQFAKVAPKLLAGQENANHIMTIFAKILALSQENTPESKLAILNLIEELGTAGKEIVNNAKEVVVQGEELKKKAQEELKKKIDAITEQYDGTSI